MTGDRICEENRPMDQTNNTLSKLRAETPALQRQQLAAGVVFVDKGRAQMRGTDAVLFTRKALPGDRQPSSLPKSHFAVTLLLCARQRLGPGNPQPFRTRIVQGHRERTQAARQTSAARAIASRTGKEKHESTALVRGEEGPGARGFVFRPW